MEIIKSSDHYDIPQTENLWCVKNYTYVDIYVTGHVIKAYLDSLLTSSSPDWTTAEAIGHLLNYT